MQTSQNQKWPPEDTTSALWRELRGIAWALATIDSSRISLGSHDGLDGEPECPFCRGGLDLEAEIDSDTVDGIAHAPGCWVERARAVVARVDVTGQTPGQTKRTREGA